jgi:cyclopropane fatty-acyl-phospholipid synthase-like methyltransferase
MSASRDLLEHYPMTLAGWSDNLVKNWDQAGAELGHGRIRAVTQPLTRYYLHHCRQGRLIEIGVIGEILDMEMLAIVTIGCEITKVIS